MNYKKKKIPDRLNEGIIKDYLKQDNIDISTPDFWISNGMAVEFSTSLKNLLQLL